MNRGRKLRKLSEVLSKRWSKKHLSGSRLPMLSGLDSAVSVGGGIHIICNYLLYSALIAQESFEALDMWALLPPETKRPGWALAFSDFTKYPNRWPKFPMAVANVYSPHPWNQRIYNHRSPEREVSIWTESVRGSIWRSICEYGCKYMVT